MRYIPRGTLVTRLKLFAAALIKAFDGQAFTINSKKLAVADIVQSWVDYEQQVAAIAAARGAWLNAIATARALEKTVVMPTVQSLQALLRGMFGLSSEQLRAFGIKPRRRKKRTGKQRAAAAAKAAATRKARGTTARKPRR